MTIHYISFEPWADDYIGDILYAPRDILADSASESKSLLSFWLGAPQEPIEVPYYQHPRDSFYYQYLKMIDYYGYQIKEAYLLPQIDNAPEYDIYTHAPQIRSLSFWLGQEAEELVG